MSMKIAVRMDDITPDMNWENFDFFLNLFEKTGITPLLGIVPDNKDKDLIKGEYREDFYDIMKNLEKKGYTLALHGCYHLYATKKGGLFPLNKFSEFAGLSYEKQKELLAHGQDRLKENGIETDIFMAPAHSYDKNTLRALSELGFTRITDGFGKRPYIRRPYKGLCFYPISFRLGSSLKKKSGVTTMVIHANTVTEADKKNYENIFSTYGGNMISYSEYLKIEPVSRGIFAAAAEYTAARFKRGLMSLKRHM